MSCPSGSYNESETRGSGCNRKNSNLVWGPGLGAKFATSTVWPWLVYVGNLHGWSITCCCLFYPPFFLLALLQAQENPSPWWAMLSSWALSQGSAVLYLKGSLWSRMSHRLLKSKYPIWKFIMRKFGIF